MMFFTAPYKETWYSQSPKIFVWGGVSGSGMVAIWTSFKDQEYGDQIIHLKCQGKSEHPWKQFVNAEAPAPIIGHPSYSIWPSVPGCSTPHAWAHVSNKTTKHNVCCLQPRQPHESRCFFFLLSFVFLISVSFIVFPNDEAHTELALGWDQEPAESKHTVSVANFFVIVNK